MNKTSNAHRVECIYLLIFHLFCVDFNYLLYYICSRDTTHKCIINARANQNRPASELKRRTLDLRVMIVLKIPNL